MINKTIITGIAILLSVSIVSASIDKNLKYGQTGAEVNKLQDFLTVQGFSTTSPSGLFGLSTFKAVKAYQASKKLPTTGYVGPSTREVMNKQMKATIVNPVSFTGPSNISTSTVLSKIEDATTSPEYGVGYIFPDGVRALSPLRRYGFYQEIIEAEKNGKKGQYNQTTKFFESYEDLKAKDDVYQASIRQDNTEISSSGSQFPSFYFPEEFNWYAPSDFGSSILTKNYTIIYSAMDTDKQFHTVRCAYANGDVGIQRYEVSNIVKQLLDNSPIFVQSSNKGGLAPESGYPALNVTKTLRPSAYDDYGLTYKKTISVCGVISNKNYQKNYIYSNN